MEQIIKIKSEYNSLDKLQNYIKKESSFETSQDYDSWEHRTDANGQMEKCIVIKKSSMNGVKVFFSKEDTIKVNHIVPSKTMNAYFGKSQKARRNIIEIISGKITQTLLSGGQKKAFEELSGVFNNAKG